MEYYLLNWMVAPTYSNPDNRKFKRPYLQFLFDRYTDPLFKVMEILTLEKSIELKTVKFIWRLKSGFLPGSK